MSADATPAGPRGLAVGPAPAFEAPAARPRLRITDVRLVSLRTVREAGSLEPAWDPGGRTRFRVGGGDYLEVHTDQGLVGIGPKVEASLLPSVNEQLAGRDPFEVEAHFARLQYYLGRRWQHGTAGVDIALWDLIGKATGLPLHRLWGGGSDRVRAYASTIELRPPESAAALAAQIVAEGWKALKLRLHHGTLEEDVRTVEAVRAEVGDGIEIMADANQAQSAGSWQPGVRWDLGRAVATARELDRLGCRWLEEPLPRYAFDRLGELNRLVELPIAGGENNGGLHEFRWLMERGAYDIVQPDSLVCGGATPLREIAALAQEIGKDIVPHHGGGALGTIAHLHLVASSAHAPYLELLHEPPIGSYRHRFAIFVDPPTLDSEGYIGLPQAPGLGVEIDPNLIQRE
jgi:D-galactarolactone cycloisomerase